MFGNKKLPDAADVVRARLAALFQPMVLPGELTAGLPLGEPQEPVEVADAEYLHTDAGKCPRRGLTSRHLAVVAAIMVIAVVASVGWLLRAKPVPMAVAVGQESLAQGSATPAISSVGGASQPETPIPSQAASSVILVHVVGAVATPGLVKLTQGARVADAITAAGGLREDADPAELNLAAVVTDGSQIIIGTKTAPRGETRDGAGSAGVVSTGGSTAQGIIDLNTATLSQLDTIPGVGPVTAQAILDYRTKRGRFTKTEELQEVDGIGVKTYAQIAPHVRV